MGNSASTAQIAESTGTQNVVNEVEASSPVQSQLENSPPPGCPIHKEMQDRKLKESGESGCNKERHRSIRKMDISDCPIHAGRNIQENEENSETLNPANQMPPPNQTPSLGQPFLLPTDRQESTIPKGGTKESWVYPSQQMFWNAMLRKGWRWEKDALDPKDMDHIIRIHNTNNEQAWQEILKWESFHAHECDQPKLLKFGGKAAEFSPRARIRGWLGGCRSYKRYELPFDRHDWIIDRCGKEVRYIIDYYDIGNEDGYKNGEFIHMDVRPAFDSFQAALDRSRVAMLRWAAVLANFGTKTDNNSASSDTNKS